MTRGQGVSFRVLVVDDDREIRDLISRYLRRELFEVETEADGENALERILARRESESGFDLLVLDVMMPGLDGFELLSRLRELDVSVPILFLTAKREDGDVIQGLGMGADEYMTKPFSPAVLTARVKALLRMSKRSAASDSTAAGRAEDVGTSDLPSRRKRELAGSGYSRGSGEVRREERGSFALERKKCAFSKHGRPISLTATEYTLLRFFFDHPDQVFTKYQLHDRCWENPYYDENTVPVYIRRLREKIEEEPDNPRHLVTIRGLGYYFAPAGGEERL
jgi:DNA-binding response OmpR family regulator